MLNLKHSNHPFHSIFPRKVPHNHNERNEIDTYTVALSSSMAARTTLFIVCERQGLAVFNGVHQLMVPEPNKKLGQPFKKQRGLLNSPGRRQRRLRRLGRDNRFESAGGASRRGWREWWWSRRRWSRGGRDCCLWLRLKSGATTDFSIFLLGGKSCFCGGGVQRSTTVMVFVAGHGRFIYLGEISIRL